MSSMNRRPFWIGVADVIPKNGNQLLGNASGAYVGVAGLSESEAAFKELVARSLEAMGFKLFHVDDLELGVLLLD